MADAGTIGTRIARRRQALRMTQEDLAQAVGVTKSSVANWESGKHFPQRKQGAVEHVLGISLEDDPHQEVAYDRVRERVHDMLYEELPEDEARRMEAIIEAGLEGRIPPRRRAPSRSEQAG